MCACMWCLVIILTAAVVSGIVHYSMVGIRGKGECRQQSRESCYLASVFGEIEDWVKDDGELKVKWRKRKI